MDAETELEVAAERAAQHAKMNGFMSKADILATPDREYREIDVSKWWGPGRKVRVQSLTAGERDAWEASYVTQTKNGTQKVNTQTIRAGLVGRSLVDEQDHLMFSLDEVLALQGKHAGAIDKIYTVCAEMNGITDADVEELQGNSGRGPIAATS
jgi:hypothetical protein